MRISEALWVLFSVILTFIIKFHVVKLFLLTFLFFIDGYGWIV